MDDSIQHLEQEQPVHERKIEPEKLSFVYVLRKIKTFYKSIDIKKRYIFLLVIVLILMLIFTIPFLVTAFIFTQQPALRDENISKYNQNVAIWNNYRQTLVNYTISLTSFDTMNNITITPINKNIALDFPDQQPSDNFTNNFQNLVWTSTQFFAYSTVNENVNLQDTFNLQITVANSSGQVSSQMATFIKFRYASPKERTKPNPKKFVLQNYCIVMDVKNGVIINVFGCDKEQGILWSNAISVQYSGSPPTYPCGGGQCVHNGTFSIRDVNDPYCQIYYILGNHRFLFWGMKYQDKLSKIILFLVLGGIFFFIFLGILAVIGILYYKYVVTHEKPKYDHIEPYFSQE